MTDCCSVDMPHEHGSPPTIYPSGEPGDCRNFSAALVHCFPELRYVEGTRTFTVYVQPDGHVESVTIEHAWTVLPDGRIWDGTLDPMCRAAEQYGLVITYVAGDVR
jgi:hypothetical protein